jgi:hypothetical protein
MSWKELLCADLLGHGNQCVGCHGFVGLCVERTRWVEEERCSCLNHPLDCMHGFGFVFFMNSVHFASAFLLVLYCVYIPDCKQLALGQFTLSDTIAVLLSDVVHKKILDIAMLITNVFASLKISRQLLCDQREMSSI